MFADVSGYRGSFPGRANSFGEAAPAYAEHRPDYPVDAVSWVIEDAPNSPPHVLDLAAGTGKLTETLVAQGFRVTAVEPDPLMLAELTQRFPEVTALDGTAENIPLPDGLVDVVVAGQAFHWFRPNKAYPEIARVLRPGGIVAGLWNHHDLEVDWVAEMNELTDTGMGGDWLAHDVMPEHPLFTDFRRTRFRHSQPRTAETMTATIGTHSRALTRTPSERIEYLRQVRSYLDSRPETATGEFELPLITTVVRAHLRP
ncbi:methyltransferase family protein [Herbihabitans rhizosphaerae]|uniref:Methyltransferase family protein n=1 Tax=Herbihabitans rhizosphaerae TaxID=1872711 RepID=A0A4Q7KWP6_9PSEU|nr:class I SAM-dependent methyltransferase [Herbihabitans rhizosphaerae]RZS41204.1 methyltransferase family protein [Herbihabitans rhizosphaerae]